MFNIFNPFSPLFLNPFIRKLTKELNEMLTILLDVLIYSNSIVNFILT